jgi:cytochrome c-type biogenesis protein CcmH/NrfG
MERAWALDGNSALAAFFVGWARRALGRDTDAISAWRAAVALDPTLVSAYLALADTFVRMRHPELAARALRDGLVRMPGSPELRAKLGEVER